MGMHVLFAITGRNNVPPQAPQRLPAASSHSRRGKALKRYARRPTVMANVLSHMSSICHRARSHYSMTNQSLVVTDRSRFSHLDAQSVYMVRDRLC